MGKSRSDTDDVEKQRKHCQILRCFQKKPSNLRHGHSRQQETLAPLDIRRPHCVKIHCEARSHTSVTQGAAVISILILSLRFVESVDQVLPTLTFHFASPNVTNQVLATYRNASSSTIFTFPNVVVILSFQMILLNGKDPPSSQRKLNGFISSQTNNTIYMMTVLHILSHCLLDVRIPDFFEHKSRIQINSVPLI